MYLKNSQHIQVQDMTCSEAGDAVMGFIEEELIKPLIVNDLIESDKIKLLSALGGAIQILTEKAQAYENLFDKDGQLPYHYN